ncbi:MAG: DUF933 domain-containing protein [bacterium]
MKVCILGLAKSGKTTMFEALTQRDVQPSHKDKFNFGIVRVPDSRIDSLSESFKPKKIIYPEIEFIDYIREEGQKGFSADYTAKLKESDGILKVVRDFANDVYPPALSVVDPMKELTELDDEIILNDLGVVEKRLEKLKTAKYKLSAEEKTELAALTNFNNLLSSGKMIYSANLDKEEEKIARNYGLISSKKEIVVVNIDDPSRKISEDFRLKLEQSGRIFALISAVNEKELNSLDSESKNEFAKEMHIEEFGIQKVIRHLYSMLNLITFFTVGEDEVKGWTIRLGTSALKAAGKIHSDIERGFIKAQITSFEDFKKHGNFKECVKHGVLRLEGKEYTMRDGDIVEFKFNV